VTPPITPSSELGVTPVLREEDVWVKESEDEVHAESPYSVGVFSEDHAGEEYVRCQNVQSGHTLFVRTVPKWAYTVCANYPKVGIHCLCELSQSGHTLFVRTVPKWAYTVCANCPKQAFVCDTSEMTNSCLLRPLNVKKNFIL
jgi:hypothetical protein